MRLWVRSLALLSGLSIRRCHELWCRPQMQLGSPVAVALALHMLRGVALEKKKKKKKQMDDLQGKIMVLEATVQNNHDERRALPER